MGSRMWRALARHLIKTKLPLLLCGIRRQNVPIPQGSQQAPFSGWGERCVKQAAGKLSLFKPRTYMKLRDRHLHLLALPDTKRVDIGVVRSKSQCYRGMT